MNLQEKQAPIDRAIVEALIAATPETWNSALMVVERRDEGPNEKMSIEITSPERHKDLVGPTDEIYEGLYRLSDCFRKQGKVWRAVRYQVNLAPTGDWKFEVSFEF